MSDLTNPTQEILNSLSLLSYTHPDCTGIGIRVQTTARYWYYYLLYNNNCSPSALSITNEEYSAYFMNKNIEWRGERKIHERTFKMVESDSDDDLYWVADKECVYIYNAELKLQYQFDFKQVRAPSSVLEFIRNQFLTI